MGVDLPDEPLGPRDVRITIRNVGVCGSDVHYYQHGRIGPFVVEQPMVLGHEAAGVIEGGPMNGTRVTINCPYTPNLSREYMLFVDPAPVAATASLLPGLASVPAAPSTARATETQAQSRPAPRAAAPIGQSTRYQVRPASRGSQRSARSVTLTSWLSASSAASLTCWMSEPA